jgi:imidazolonepropionase-like amidohydrolase
VTDRASLAFDGAELFDGSGGPPVADASVVIASGRIVHAGPGTIAADRRIDVRGAAILPGLIDLHVHVGAITGEDAGRDLGAIMEDCRAHRPGMRSALLGAGVTTIRSVGDVDTAILMLRREVARGALVGPRVVCAGPVFTAPGGHPVSTIYARHPELAERGARQVDSVEAARLEVNRLFAAEVDGIKVVYSGKPKLSTEILYAIADAARAKGRWLAVHTSSLADVVEATRAGATTIEHGVTSGEPLDRDVADAMRVGGVTYVPTLTVLSERFSTRPERVARALANVRVAHEAGVRIGAGTDAQGPGMRFADALARELGLLVDAGLSAAHALISVTSGAAAALGRAALGRIQVGCAGDLVVIDGRPWERIDDIRRVRIVVQAGRLVVKR